MAPQFMAAKMRNRVDTGRLCCFRCATKLLRFLLCPECFYPKQGVSSVGMIACHDRVHSEIMTSQTADFDPLE